MHEIASSHLQPTDTESKKIKHGIGLIIMNRNGDIWTILEKKKRKEHARKPGERSIPFETKKNNETIEGTVMGALAEVCNDNDIQILLNNLYCLRNIEKSVIKGFRTIKNLECDYVVLYYDGDPKQLFQALDQKEASYGKWTHPNRLFGRKIRKYALETVRDIRDNKKFPALFHIYQEAKIEGLLQLAFPQSFSINNFYQQRERGRDI
ncbi:MAG: hypothetical protein Q7R95_04955 [bacterium]|nr:hypothetical protein [bacterium]